MLQGICRAFVFALQGVAGCLARAASGDKTGRNLSDVFGPKAHCAEAIQRILHTMS